MENNSDSVADPTDSGSSVLDNIEALSKSLEAASVAEKTYDPMRDSSRVYATQTFIAPHHRNPSVPPDVNFLTVTEQEKALTKDLLYILSGVDSSLVSVYHISHNKVGFTVDDRIDPSLKDLTLQITQVASYYHTTQKYIEMSRSFDYGKANQALGAAMRPFIREYRNLICRLETMFLKGQLNLQNLWFHVHKTVEQLSIMSSIAAAIENVGARGGQVLSILHEKAVTTMEDQSGNKICMVLADSASQPYFRMLENWIYKGKINDPFHEFFIADLEEDDDFDEEVTATTDDYWERRYSMNTLLCPVFLRKVSNEILKAGKYLNVILQVGPEDGGLYMGEKIPYSIHEYSYVEYIQNAYLFASKTLLALLLNEYDLMRRIVSVKHYLLMDQGDFIIQFLDLAKDELKKEISDLNEMKLNSLLECAVRASSPSTDPYRDNVAVQLFPTGIRDMLDHMIAVGTPREKTTFETEDAFVSIPAIEAFSLKLDVKWPVSLVLNGRAMANYQLIFRHLFYCKHVERSLYDAWIVGNKKYKGIRLQLDTEKSAAFSLLLKMMNFVQNLLYYMAFEVIEPAWHSFLATMSKVQNIDQVKETHTSFICSIVHDSMLTTSDLLEKITGLLACCLEFSKKFIETASSQSSSNTNYSSEFDRDFSSNLIQFLRYISRTVQNPHQSSKVINIVHRMDFNGYYTAAIQEDNLG